VQQQTLISEWKAISNQSTIKRPLDGCPQNIMRLPGGATNTTFAPERQKPSRRHWLEKAFF
jgi:hypothetical protein